MRIPAVPTDLLRIQRRVRRGAVVCGLWLALTMRGEDASYATTFSACAAEGFSGAVLVARTGTVRWRAAAGYADAAAGQRNTPETRFRIGSVTKAFTAALTLRLAAHGEWSLDEPLGQRWPELPERWQPLTPRLLLSHQAGVVELTAVPDFDRADAPARAYDRLRSLLGGRALDFPPGTRAAYSNSNYILLGAWLERVEGRSFAKLIEREIGRPAGLHDTALAAAGNHAHGYAADRTRWEEVTERDPGLLDAAGALVSTVDDLWRFWRALRDGPVLDAVQRDEMFAPRRGGFAYGWRRQTILGGREIVFQPGEVRGFSAVVMYEEARETLVIVLSNRATHEASTVALRLLAAEE